MADISLQVGILLGFVGVFTVATAVSDLRSRRIPNAMTVPMFVLGLIYQAVFNQWAGLADAGQAFAMGFGILLVLWLVGGGGGGDVKLMGALSVWLGFYLTLLVLVTSTVLVLFGTMAVVIYSVTRRGVRKTQAKYVASSEAGKGKGKKHKPAVETLRQRQQRRMMAYALPVAVATWAIMIWKFPSL
ncbi:MAG: A24 family peptidase [Planctomycetaceae bacterium]